MKNREINRFLTQVASALIVLLALVGCQKRQTLSDDELAQVFHDAFLANAYATSAGLKLDSLKLYEPIFLKYGYSTKDVQYTIGSFSTRKSARLSDVVEQAIRMLESEGKMLDREVAVLDTISNIAVRRTASIVYADSLITFTSFRDTVDMNITLEGLEEGQYYINFDYRIDSIDTTPKGYRASRWVENRVPKVAKKAKAKAKGNKSDKEEAKSAEEVAVATDSIEYETKRVSSNSTTLNRSRVAEYSTSIKVEANTERLVLSILRPIEMKGIPSVTIKNLKIKRVLGAERAQDSLYKQLLPIRIFSDELLPKL